MSDSMDNLPPLGSGKAVGRKSDKVTVALVIVLLVGAVLLGWQETKESELLPDGAAAPDFSMKRHGGGTVTLAQLKGRVVLIDFWATWCPPCRKEMPWLVTLAQEFEPKGVTFLAVSNDDGDEQGADGDVAKFAKKVSGLGPFIVEGTQAVSDAYKVQMLPTLYILDREGRVVKGKPAMAEEADVRRWLEEAVAD